MASSCTSFTAIIEVKLTKISYVGTLKFGSYRVPVYSGFGLFRVWLIQGTSLFRVWFRQISLYIIFPYKNLTTQEAVYYNFIKI